MKWEKMFADYILNKGFTQNICIKNSTTKKTQKAKKMGKELE